MVNRTRQTRRSLPRILIVLGVLVAGGVLTYGIARAAGWLDKTAPLAQKPSREGMVRVPKSLVSLRAFQVVQREDVYNRSAGDDSYFWLPKKQVEAHPEWITRVDDIIGRVMARDKRSDFVFSAKDFLPEGSRSGIAGGVPAGKQGFFLDADKVPGLRFLKKGDRFDLLASLPDESEEASSEYGLIMGGVKARGGKPVPLDGVRILVQNAELIALTTSRSMTTQGGLALTEVDSRGRASSNPKDERVAIAIEPAEAVPLTQALGDEMEIHMVTRSGQQTESQADDDLLNGRIAFPATAVSIEAFQPIRASDLAEPGTSELRQYFFLPADVRDGWIPRPEALIGRVVRNPIEPGYIFSEADFLVTNSLVNEIKAFESLEIADLVGGATSGLVGRIAARDLAAGSLPSENDFLSSDSLIVDVAAYDTVKSSDLVDGRVSKLAGRVAAREIPAGQIVSENDLLPANSLIRNVKAYEVVQPADLVDGGRSLLAGRVAAGDLAAGSLLAETDLLRPGAKPGFTAAIPPDRMAMTIDVAAVQGAAGLTRGDRCDLLASSEFDVSAALGGVELSAAVRAELQAKAVNQVLATDAIVIQTGEQEVVVAVLPPEVSSISKAVSLDQSLFCITRTSLGQTAARKSDPSTIAAARPDDKESDGMRQELVSDPNPLDKISISETLIGGQRTMRAYRRTQ